MPNGGRVRAQEVFRAEWRSAGGGRDLGVICRLSRQQTVQIWGIIDVGKFLSFQPSWYSKSILISGISALCHFANPNGVTWRWNASFYTWWSVCQVRSTCCKCIRSLLTLVPSSHLQETLTISSLTRSGIGPLTTWSLCCNKHNPGQSRESSGAPRFRQQRVHGTCFNRTAGEPTLVAVPVLTGAAALGSLRLYFGTHAFNVPIYSVICTIKYFSL